MPAALELRSRASTLLIRTSKRCDDPENNDTADKKTQAVLMPGDAIRTIAQMAITQSKLFQYL